MLGLLLWRDFPFRHCAMHVCVKCLCRRKLILDSVSIRVVFVEGLGGVPLLEELVQQRVVQTTNGSQPHSSARRGSWGHSSRKQEGGVFPLASGLVV